MSVPFYNGLLLQFSSAGQSLLPDLYTNGNTFYAPTVTVGSVDLAPSLFTDGDTFYTPVIDGGGTTNLAAELFTNTNTFYSAVITGAITLAPSLFTNTQTFYSATVADVTMVRDTQSTLLVLTDHVSEARDTQSTLLVLAATGSPVRDTQSVLLTLVDWIPDTRITQSVLLVLADHIPCVTHYAECWKITRTDNTVFAFTGHDKAIAFGSVTYQPCHSLMRGANESTSGEEVGNLDLKGIISDEAITAEDIRLGLFRDALVEVWLIPWQDDGMLAKRLQSGVVGAIQHGREGFNFDVLTPNARLQQRPLLKPHKPGCRYKFGDSQCTFDTASITVTGTVDGIATGPDVFRTFADSTRSEPDGDFDFGALTWLTGDNAGGVSEIKTFIAGTFTLWQKMPNRIVAGDTYSAVPGCDKSPARCQNYGNYINFGGFPDVPGNDKLITTPNAKA